MSGRKAETQAAKNQLDWPEFHLFMTGFWVETADLLYSDLAEALEDFKSLKGDQRFDALRREFAALIESQRLPSRSKLRTSRNKPFWSCYHRLITIEQAKACESLELQSQ